MVDKAEFNKYFIVPNVFYNSVTFRAHSRIIIKSVNFLVRARFFNCTTPCFKPQISFYLALNQLSPSREQNAYLVVCFAFSAFQCALKRVF